MSELLRPNKNHYKRYTLILALGLLISLIYFRKNDIANSIRALPEARAGDVALSALLFTGTIFSASFAYKFLCFKPVAYPRILLVQAASLFTNRLLPAGIGGLATTARFLVKQRYSVSGATAVVSVNNLLGFAGLLILTFTVGAVSNTKISQAADLGLPGWALLIIFAAVAVAGVVFLVFRPARKRTLGSISQIAADITLIARRPFNLALALIASMAITFCYAASLYFCMRAFGQSPSALQTLIVLTAGVGAASITPTPGGIGGAEAGLVAGMRAVGIPTDTSISVALVYRLITFWLPLIPGYVAFRVALARKLI